MKIVLLLLLMGTLSGSNCFEHRPAAIGDPGEILVFADNDTWAVAGQELLNTLERTIYTPQSERAFFLRRVLPDEFERYYRYRNLIFMSALTSTGPTADLVKKMLSPEARSSVERGEHFMFMQQHEYAQDQLLVLLSTPTPEDMRENIRRDPDWLYRQFEENLYTALERRMFRRLEEKKLERALWNKYEWTLRIEYDYQIALEKPEARFVWLRKYDPDRLLFVHWMDAEDGSRITPAWLLAQREHLGLTYCDSMQVDDKHLTHEERIFAGFDALQLTGLWSIPQKVLGGPFICTAFFDEYKKRIYIVDVAVLAPGREKLPWLRLAYAMARNFSVRPFEWF